MALNESVIAAGTAAQHRTDHNALHVRANDLLSPRNFAAVAGSVLNSAESTTGWSATVGPPTLDTTNKTTGSASVTTAVSSGVTTNVAYVNVSASVASYDRVLIDFRWQRINGFSGDLSDTYTMKLASASALGGTVVSHTLADYPELTWVTVIAPVGALSSLGSIGMKSDAGVTQGGGAAITVWFDNLRFAAVSEIDAALSSASDVALLVPPTFTSAVTEDPRIPDPANKVVLDMRPGRQYVTGLGGVRDIREWDVASDGLSDVSGRIADAISALDPGDTLRLAANGYYWCDKILRLARDGVTIDLNGSTIFTRLFKGGNNNVSDPVFSISANDVTLRNGYIFGYNDRVTTGANLVTDTGTVSTVSTTKVLDAANEAVRAPLVNAVTSQPFYARHPLVQFPTATRALISAYDPTFRLGNAFVVSLSDTNHVAGDCVIELVADDNTAVTLASRTLTLTGAQTDYVLSYSPTDLHRCFRVRVRKATATANAITVHSMTEYGVVNYDSTHDSANVISVGGSQRLLIEDMWVEGGSTDALDCTSANNYDVTVRRFTSRACQRQGLSFNRGTRYTLSDFTISEAGRSGIDIEPFAVDWLVDGLSISNGRIYNSRNYGLALTNWAGITDLSIENVEVYGTGVGGMIGGARTAKISGLHTVSQWNKGIMSSSAPGVALNGIAMNVDLACDGNASIGTSTSGYDAGAGAVIYTSERNDVTVTLLSSTGRANLGSVGTANRLTSRPTGNGQHFSSSTSAGGTDWPGDSSSVFQGADAAQQSWPRTLGLETAFTVPVVPGGYFLTHQPLTAARAIGRASSSSLVTNAVITTNTTGSSVDLGVRGRSGMALVNVSAVSGTAPTLDGVIQCSQDNTNWYTVTAVPRFTATGTFPFPIRYLERYVRAVWTVAGSSPSFSTRLDLELALPGNNLGETGVAVTASATTKAVTFPSRSNWTGSASALGLAATTGGSLTPSTTYFYRAGIRSRSGGAATWLTEVSTALGGAQNAMSVQLAELHQLAYRGLASEGFTLLRGTSTGTYTQRYDVLPKAGLVTSAYRHDFTGLFTDLGASLTPSASMTGFPTTYPTASGPYAAVDESGWEPDTAYGVIVTPSWGTTVHVTAKATSGFTANFGTAAPGGGGTIDYWIYR